MGVVVLLPSGWLFGSQLLYCSLSSNWIGSDGLDILVLGLRSNTTLTKLRFPAFVYLLIEMRLVNIELALIISLLAVASDSLDLGQGLLLLPVLSC